MTNKTLPTLTATTSLADNTLFLVRRNGQVEDESTLGSNLKTFLYSSVAIIGGTIDGTAIGGTTPAAGAFTTLASNTIDTGQGAVECYAMDQAVQTTDDVTFNSLTLTTDLALTEGGTGASTASGARTNLGLGSAAVEDTSAFLQPANNLSDITLASTARTNLGLGSLAVLSSVNNDNWSGTDLSVLNGGTGASDASGARTNLGLVIGTDVQAQDNHLQALADVTGAGADKLPYFTSGTTMATTSFTSFARTLLDDSTASAARTTLGLGDIATQSAASVVITGGSITGITDLAVADGGTGASTAGGARTNLGLGSIATQDANNVTISGGSITGISDIAITDGGTGASTASAARTNLGLEIGVDVQAYDATILNDADIGVTVQAYDADTVKSDVATAFTAQQNFSEATLTDAASISWNLASAQTAKVTLGGNRTMSAPTNLVAGGTYVLRVIQDGTGSRTITWNAVFKWPGGTPPTLSSGAGDIDVITFVSDGTNMYGVSQLDFT